MTHEVPPWERESWKRRVRDAENDAKDQAQHDIQDQKARSVAVFENLDPAEVTACSVVEWLRHVLPSLPWQDRADEITSLVEVELSRVRLADTVRAVERQDPILAVVRTAPERDGGQLAFSGLVPDDPPAQLPTIPAPAGPRVPLLELADAAGVPTLARGRGAPLPLRIAVAATLLTPHASRAGTARLAVTVRELRDFLYPHGWERSRHWPAIRRALREARDYVIPVGGGCWYPVALRFDPGPAAALDDVILMDVALPPGSAAGPPVDRGTLAALGVQSAPGFRAYLAAHAIAWLPGRTRVVVPRSGGRRVWTTDVSRYPVLTSQDRDRLAFGAVNAVRKMSRADKDAVWAGLPEVEVLDRDAVALDGDRSGWLVLPQDAAAAVRGRQRGDGWTTTGGKEDDNGGMRARQRGETVAVNRCNH